MIITHQKPLADILEALKDYKKVYLVGCGECSTSCKTGGQAEVAKMKAELEANGKVVVGIAIPSAPCVAAKLKAELAKDMKALREAEAVLVLSCGLGVQSVKDNDRFNLAIYPACDTICGAVMDAKGNFTEKCSMCGECVLDITAGSCPVTLCPKGLLNGPCGGVVKGKCEVDKDRDCIWVLIYNELEKRKSLGNIRKIRAPRDFKKSTKPHKVMMTNG